MERIVLAYERVSSDEQKRKGFSISDQFQEIEKVAGTRGDVIYHHFIDDGHSGTNMHRKGVKNLLHMIATGNVKRLYITYANRLSRDDAMIRSLRKVFFKYNVEVISLNDDWAAENDNADRKLSCDLVSRVDSSEPQRAKIRTRAGLRMSAKLGNWPLGKVPLGFLKVENPKSIGKGHMIVPNEDWRPAINTIVRLIQSKLMSGQSIANHLNSNNELHRAWTAKEVLAIASNPEYYGCFDQSYYFAEDHHEGFYTKEDHILMHKILHGRCREKKYTYLFKGLLYCADCGSLLTCIPTLKKVKGKNNLMAKRPIFYYYCRHCNMRINEAKLLPDILFDFECTLIEDPSVIEERKKYFRKVERIKTDIELLEDDYFDEIVSFDYFEEKRKKLLELLKITEDKMHRIESNVNEWISMTREEQRNRIRSKFKMIRYNLKDKIIEKIVKRSDSL